MGEFGGGILTMCGRRGDLGSGGHRAGGDIFVTFGHCVVETFEMFSTYQTYPIASFERKRKQSVPVRQCMCNIDLICFIELYV